MAVIAVVEDEQAIARLISLHLQSAGYEPKLYETGDEFLRSLRGDVPDLVLLDWMLPGENDGIAVLKALRANEKTRAVPVIMPGRPMNRIRMNIWAAGLRFFPTTLANRNWKVPLTYSR